MGRRGQGGFCPGAAMAGLRQGEIPASLREHAFSVGSDPGAGVELWFKMILLPPNRFFRCGGVGRGLISCRKR